MLREVALRKALQEARNRRAQELAEVEARLGALRRRLRELSDRALAVGMVHARFFAEANPLPGTPASPLPGAPASPPTPTVTIEVTPREPSMPLLPVPRPEEIHATLLGALAERFPDGFTVAQMQQVMEELEGRARSYDAAWALAGTLQRARALDVAGSRKGPTGVPIRIFRVAPRTVAAEAG